MTEIKLKSYTLKSGRHGIFCIPCPGILHKCSRYVKSRGFDYIHKIVMKTKKYPIAIDILKEYLDIFPKKINRQNDRGWTALHLACKNSKTKSTEETVEFLLSYSYINVNLQNDNGFTPLHLACELYNSSDTTERTVKLLIKHPTIDVNLKNYCGETPLHLTCKSFRINRKIDILLTHPNINVNVQNNLGHTPLHLAYHHVGVFNTLRAIEMLLLHPTIDVNLQDINGETALNIAFEPIFYKQDENIREKSIDLLLSHSAINVNLQDDIGWTVLHRACQRRQIKIVRILLKIFK